MQVTSSCTKRLLQPNLKTTMKTPTPLQIAALVCYSSRDSDGKFPVGTETPKNFCNSLHALKQAGYLENGPVQSWVEEISEKGKEFLATLQS